MRVLSSTQQNPRVNFKKLISGTWKFLFHAVGTGAVKIVPSTESFCHDNTTAVSGPVINGHNWKQLISGEMIHIYLLYRHECFTGKYTTRKIHKNYIRDLSGLLSIISHVSLSMT